MTVLCVLLLFTLAISIIANPLHRPVKKAIKPVNDKYTIDWSIYHNYESVSRKLLDFSHHPYVSLHQFDQLTSDGHPLIVARFTDKSIDQSNGQSKIKILLTFGEHPRELVTVESCLALLDELTAFHGTSSTHSSPQSIKVPTRYAQFIASHFDLHLVCMMNPSGLLVQERASTHPPTNRPIKQLKQPVEPPFCRRWNGQGVDLNRNSAWQWGAAGANGLPSGASARLGDEEYRGVSPFSEVESQLILELADNDYTVYASIHSGEQQVFVPFVDSVSARSHYVRADRQAVDKRLIDHLMNHSNGYIHSGGVGWKANSYAADGTYYDWMAGEKNVPYTLCFEAWGDASNNLPIDQCFSQFNPRPSELTNDLKKIQRVYHSLFEFVLKEERGLTYEMWNGKSVSEPVDELPHQPIDRRVAKTADLLAQLHQLEQTLVEAAALLSNG